MKIMRAIAMSLLGTLVLSVPARAGSIEISYNFTGGLTAPPLFSGGLLYLNGSATGPVDQFDPLVNAAWNPVTFVTTDALDLSTGFDNGTFTWTFANGEMLSGLMFEDDTTVDFTTNTGPFTQTLTFTAGTGEFAGVAGSSFGNGLLTSTGYTVSGSGTLAAPGLIAAAVPEPTTLLIFSAGLAGAAAMRRRKAKSV